MRSTTLTSPPRSEVDESTWTREEAFAAALALMTEHAKAPDEGQPALAQTVSMYLMGIAGAFCPSTNCRLALLVLAAHWAAMGDAPSFRDEDVVLWHVSPATIQ